MAKQQVFDGGKKSTGWWGRPSVLLEVLTSPVFEA